MCSHLPLPLTLVEVYEHRVSAFDAASASMQGWRERQEDSLVSLASLKRGACKELGNDREAFVSGVFDGHGGGAASFSLSRDLPDVLAEELHTNDGYLTERSLKSACLEMDRRLIRDGWEKGQPMDVVGSTGVFAVLRQPADGDSRFPILVANVGDSRAFLVRDGCVVAATTPHRANTPEELTRIHKAGGWVEHGRVRGHINMTRCFGDFFYKASAHLPQLQQQLTAEPDVSEWEGFPGDLLILASDGLTDYANPDELAAMAFYEWQQTNGKRDTLGSVAVKLIQECFTRGSADNLTVSLISVRDDTVSRETVREGFAPPTFFPAMSARFLCRLRRKLSDLGVTMEEEEGQNRNLEREEEGGRIVLTAPDGQRFVCEQRSLDATLIYLRSFVRSQSDRCGWAAREMEEWDGLVALPSEISASRSPRGKLKAHCECRAVAKAAWQTDESGKLRLMCACCVCVDRLRSARGAEKVRNLVVPKGLGWNGRCFAGDREASSDDVPLWVGAQSRREGIEGA
uniref:PPM-type phosphatase domain-containing protein n=1 Tax=Chromera velia CCMP2878 TaxID=1169474 RepID=A0A0G4F0Z6_9ALVE|eukprot:Cvel_14578.t1-p1 / transcript=Cvel_14578.t1 / gene=Cvel_14578 / organism=Chromera_velia_CCMP2878 / gene_product=Probable protein phosphatase 1N, putative / transcript_product=Probable protein phosphatase 1N, putative / location=Cvel_scaffold1042:30647-32191(-) / protein_length=515 / sequence_SO=supercontig / SO=protein_coding / is_pseudo=false